MRRSVKKYNVLSVKYDFKLSFSGDYNDTCGPNLSAEAKMRSVKLVTSDNV